MGEFQDNIDGSVENHPLEGFQKMGNTDDGQNYAEQLAKMLNDIATNVVIPVDGSSVTEQDVKQWMANNSDAMDGPVMIQNGDGSLKRAKIPNDVAGVNIEDINIDSVGNSNKKFKPENPLIYTDERDKFNVAGINQTARFAIAGEAGEDVDDRDTEHRDKGYKVTFDIDLSKYVVIKIRAESYRAGEDGEEGYAAHGGASTALLDSGDNIIAHAGGGNGADIITEYSYGNPSDWIDGGLGGGPNGYNVDSDTVSVISSGRAEDFSEGWAKLFLSPNE